MAKDDPAKMARDARLIARGALKGALATTRRAARASAKGHPYVSKVGVAVDVDGAPLFLFSTLAAHTQDLLADQRASVLLETTASAQNPLEDARCTLVGKVKKLTGADADAARAAYLARHPGAQLYAGFGDFAMWRMDVDKVHYVGGFGMAKWIKAQNYLTFAPDLAQAQDRLLAQLNRDKCDDLRAVLAAVRGRSARGWKALRLDTDGLAVVGPKGVQARIDFASPAKNARAWRARFQALVKRYRG